MVEAENDFSTDYTHLVTKVNISLKVTCTSSSRTVYIVNSFVFVFLIINLTINMKSKIHE